MGLILDGRHPRRHILGMQIIRKADQRHILRDTEAQILDGGKRRERFLPGQVEFTVCKYIGEDLDLSYGAGVWVVGVGAAIENPFAFESLYILYDEPRFGKHISVYTCMKDGKYVYIDDWRASHGSPITAIEDRINIDNSSKSSHLYDLQGRRLTDKPTKGIYIQNGRKYVVVKWEVK